MNIFFVRGNGQNTNGGGQLETPLIIATKDNTQIYANGNIFGSYH